MSSSLDRQSEFNDSYSSTLSDISNISNESDISNESLLSSLIPNSSKTTSDKSINDIIPEFSKIKISTETIIAVSNLVFDLNNLYNYLPIVEYVVVKRKRGRKKKVEIIDPNKDVPVGSIISVQNKTNVRGAVLKKKKESKTYFLNSITIIVMLEHGKMINTKISKNGKFQITGCKSNDHFINCVRYVYDKKGGILYRRKNLYIKKRRKETSNDL